MTAINPNGSHFRSDGTRNERTNWRDERISQRHREWGFNCPAVDLDFLVIEYNFGLPVALIEYKMNEAKMPDLRHPTYQAQKVLADRAGLPYLLVFYWPDVWAFRAYPANDLARKWFSSPYEDLSEREFVLKLYRLRQQAVADQLFQKLNTAPVPSSANG